MITATAFREEHERGFDGRPQRIKRLRAEFRAYCGLDVPRSAAAVMEWYTARKGVVTRRLNELEADE